MTPIPLKNSFRQITHAVQGHILTHTGVWSSDSQWLVYDLRQDETRFDGDRIEVVQVDTGVVQTLFRASHNAHCGVATWHPIHPEIVFILGPENPTSDWSYAPSRRQGMLQRGPTFSHFAPESPAQTLDARDLTAPFTPGALRGGTHVHVFSPDASRVSFTYDDEILTRLDERHAAATADSGPQSSTQRTDTQTLSELSVAPPAPPHEPNQRNVGVTLLDRPVHVPLTHPRNHHGTGFSVLVTRTVPQPRSGSDEIRRACEEAWVGTRGYVKADGTRQHHALAFQGEVLDDAGRAVFEVFIVDLPADLTRPGAAPLQGTDRTRPSPPYGTVQRRLTRTVDRKYPGIQGPRHWLRSSPDGNRIAFLMRDDHGIVQLWTVSPLGGDPVQWTFHAQSISSAFSWAPNGSWIAFILDNSVFVAGSTLGVSHRLTPRVPDPEAPRHHACVFSPDGRRIAYMRPVTNDQGTFDQIFVVDLPESLLRT